MADADSNPSCTPRVAAFARFWREMPKIVFSRTPERAEWNTTVVREVVPEQIRELQAQPGGDMVVGGAGLGAAFMEHDLIDEYRIYVHPIVIGRGKPLFRPSARRIALGLGETRTFGNGVGLLRQAARNGTSFARGVFISAKDLARKLMRYMKRYNQQAKPIKWRYCDPSDRIRPNGSALSVTGN